MISFSSPLICSGEGLPPEMSALATFFGDLNYLVTPPPPVFVEIYPSSKSDWRVTTPSTWTYFRRTRPTFSLSVYVFPHGKENLTNLNIYFLSPFVRVFWWRMVHSVYSCCQAQYSPSRCSNQYSSQEKAQFVGSRVIKHRSTRNRSSKEESYVRIQTQQV